MSYSISHEPTNTLGTLWHRFNVWRALRLLRSIPRLQVQAEERYAKAQILLREHAEDPQASLPLQMPTKAIDQRAREADGR